MANLRVDKITSTETFETTGSVQFDGNNDKLIVGSAGDFNYLHNGAASFTAEFWVYTKVANSRQVVFSTGGNSSSTGFVVRIMASGAAGSGNGYLVGAQTSKSSSGNYLYWDSESTQLAASTWYHIATVYDHTDNTLKIYVDGKLTNSGFSRTQGTFGSHATGNSQAGIYIGEEAYNNSLDLNGFVSNFRIINGVKLYTSNFKPPMKELEVTAETTVLCCQSKTDELLEKTGKTIVMNGTAKACELTPGLLTPVVKSGGGSAITGSVEFSGNYDGLVLPKSTDFAFGTGDFTIEGWFNVSDTGAIRTIFDSRNTDNLSTGIFIGINSDDNLYTYGFPSSTGATNYVIPKHGEWHHFAVVRNGSSGLVFLNGIKVSGSINTGSTNYTDQGATIGQPSTVFAVTLYRYKGFLSNIRVNKGTALYTDNFIPPTRELKRVPGTVLLCCQDPDSPFTEATGKTFNGFGDFQRSNGIEYISEGDFIAANKQEDETFAEWDIKNNANITISGTTISVTSTQNYSGIKVNSAYLPTLVAGKKYAMTVDIVSLTNPIRFGVVSGNTLSDISTAGKHTLIFTGTASTTEIFIEKATGSNSTFVLDSVSLKEIDGLHPSSNFTPQVGDDRKVTFEGVTKINSNAYFYLPTGNTESRDKGAGTRGISFGGADGSNRLNTISYINISTTGDAENFGDLLDKINQQASAASSTRGISAGGFGTSPTSNEIVTVNYITMASTGDALDFGDLTLARRLLVGCSSQTRGIFAGGYDAPNKYNTMDYVTIATQGDALDFGDMVADGQTPNGRYSPAGYASPTRGVWHGGYGAPAYRNIIDYVTIASKGNTKDFGDSSISNYYMGGCSNSIRGLSGGAYNPSPAHLNLIEYTTIATTGNAKDFGDLSSRANSTGACASQIRGLWLGATIGGSHSNRIDYVTIMSMGNALDFGDLTGVTAYNAGCSNGHGGLG